MIFTPDKPKEDGYYWHLIDLDSQPIIVQVVGDYFSFSGSDDIGWMPEGGGFWSEKIPIPFVELPESTNEPILATIRNAGIGY